MEKIAVLYIAFNRPVETKTSLKSIEDNVKEKFFDFFAFIDSPKSNKDFELNQEVTEIIKTSRLNFIVHKRERNLGLKENIESAIKYIIGLYSKFIIIEDDICVGKHTFWFLKDSLKNYEDENSVFQISGYNFNVPLKLKKTPYFLPVGTSQIWGSYSRVWKNYFSKMDSINYNSLNFRQRLFFNVFFFGGFKKMLKNQLERKDKTSWAIFFRLYIAQENGLVLFPPRNLIRNIGWKENATNSRNQQLVPDEHKFMNQKVIVEKRKPNISFLGMLDLVFYYFKEYYAFKLKE